MNVNMLKGKITEKGLTQEAVAVAIGTSRSSFNAKINGTNGAEFSLREIRSLRALLNLNSDQIDAIFFT